MQKEFQQRLDKSRKTSRVEDLPATSSSSKLNSGSNQPVEIAVIDSDGAVIEELTKTRSTIYLIKFLKASLQRL